MASNNSSSTVTPLVLLPSSTPNTNYLETLNRWENYMALLCQSVAICLDIHLLARIFGHSPLLIPKGVSLSLRLFLSLHTVGLISTLPSTIQKVFAIFNPNEHLQSLFWIFAINGNYFAIGPFFVLFLTLDRIICFKFPLKESRKYFPRIVPLFVFLFYCLSFIFFIAELPLDPKAALRCAPLVCIAAKFRFLPQLVMKTTFGTLNLICSIAFFYWLGQNDRMKLKNKVVKFTIIFELIFNVLPGHFSLLYNLIAGQASTQIFGDYTPMLSYMDSLCCAIYYNWVLLNWMRILMGASVNPSTNNNIIIVGGTGQNQHLRVGMGRGHPTQQRTTAITQSQMTL